MLEVPRHKFVPQEVQRFAYRDHPLPIGHQQTISQPYIVALMSELARVGPEDKVLEIGTGSGYQAAILAEIAGEVYTIEILKPLAESSRTRLKELGYKNIWVKWGDGYLGWEEFAPYDAIVVTCAPDQVPFALIEQLEVGGRLVVPVGTLFQELKLIIKTEQAVQEESIIPVRFVPMIKSN
jgi:protein-L-isoaspartate(D-aspartate) O-methyltransferase